MLTHPVSKNFALYLVGVALSCGPSQVYGLVRGVFDLRKLSQLREKIAVCDNIEQLYLTGKFEELKSSKAFKALHAGSSKNEKELCLQLYKQTLEKHFELSQEQKLLHTSLKIDLVSLVPLAGALLAWRLNPGAPSCGLACLPGVEFSTAHALNGFQSAFTKFLYPYSGKTMDDYLREGGTICEEVRIQIPVPSRTGQTLDALFWPGKDARPTDPAIVLFHGNGMIAHEMLHYLQFFQALGFNVLAPTMGGYPGSPGVETSEASTYQDVEAVKLFLQKQGITQAGYFGFSIGGTLAFQAATAASEANIQTLFVVADQTLTTAVEAFENNANAVIPSSPVDCSPIGRGVSHAALPIRQVRLSDTLSVMTDGLNNRHKAALLGERGIPMLAVKSDHDAIMGCNYDATKKRFMNNFADDLYKARYKNDQPPMLVEIPGHHGACFLTSPDWERIAAFVLAYK